MIFDLNCNVDLCQQNQKCIMFPSYKNEHHELKLKIIPQLNVVVLLTLDVSIIRIIILTL